MQAEEGPPPFAGDIDFDWYDEATEHEWKASQKRAVLYGLVLGPILVLTLLGGFWIGAGLGIGLIIQYLVSKWQVTRWNRGFPDEIEPARASFVEDRLVVSRGAETVVDCAIEDVSGFTYSLKSRPSLILHLKDRKVDQEIRIYHPETYSVGFGRTIGALDERLPFEAIRGFVSEDRVPIRSQKRWRPLVFLGTAAALIAGAVYVMRNDALIDSPAWFFVMVGGVVMGPVLIALAVIEFARQATARIDQFEDQFFGKELCRFEPDGPSVGGPSAASWVCAAAVFLLVPPAIMFPRIMWWSIPLSLIFIALYVWTRHLKRAYLSTVVLTDQYLYVVQGRRLYFGRHGQYPFEQGSIVLGWHVPFPAQAICFGLQRAVTVRVHNDDLNEFYRWLDKLTGDSAETLEALDAFER